MIPQEDPAILKNDILNQYVGPEISRSKAFGIRQMKYIKTLINNSPTFKECKLILEEIVHIKENIVSLPKVILFLTKMIEKYIPYKLLFQRNFFNKFIKNMQQFLKFNTKQQLTLGFVMKGLAEKQDPLRRNVIAKIVMWLVNVFLINLVRSLFYVSIGNKGNALVFVKHEFWIIASKISIQKMITNNQIVEVNEPIKITHLKNIKFYHKYSGSGYRPVVTNSKSDQLHKYKFEVCNIFLKQLIAFKKKSFPNPSKELHAAWLNHLKIKNRNRNCYFVKTDIKDAYGSIIHHKLKSILKDWCDGLEDDLILMSFGYKGKWGKMKTMKQFLNLIPSAGDKILVCKSGTEKNMHLSELISDIFHYIDNIYVAFSKKNYKLNKGLHQGGKLSAALCEIYYTSLDHNYLTRLSDFNKGDILLRAVDDYIFISQDRLKTNEFLEIMTKGIPEYGMEIQSEKTVTNLNEFNKNDLASNSNIPFFGFNLDVKHGYITPCLSNYENINIKSTIAFNKLNKGILMQKMSSIIALKLHPLLFDHTYQSVRILLQNIHCASCVMAIKFIATVKLLKLAEIMLEEEYLMSCIKKSVSAIALYVYRKGKKAIEYNATKKMALKSFILIFRRKKYNFKLLEMLQLKASHLTVKSKRVDRYIKSVGKVLHPSLSYSLMS
ncbi:telomerase reverse transcriptase [Halyomorpha halys]|uniref:telomerase reverse transcriptase n=1 Tax=Halyomorpha halys TaxID=286706 RepID=UPI0034D197A2